MFEILLLVIFAIALVYLGAILRDEQDAEFGPEKETVSADDRLRSGNSSYNN